PLRTEHDELCDSDDPEEGERQEAIERRLDEIDAMARIWPDELKACAGAVVSLSHAGAAEIERGLIREEDADRQQDDDQREDGPDGEAAADRSPFPASLIEELSAQKTAALRIATARSPDKALAAAVHALAISAF